MIRSKVVGWGSYLPEKIVTNAELATKVETNDEWIVERTGIRQRHIAAPGEFTSHLGAKAAQAALKRANLTPADIDMVILATTTVDETMPSTATKIQHMLGMERGAAFDIAAACSGFVYALATADGFIRTGQAKRILVIGAETFSRIVDWNDRSTCILFGDGAGALVLEASEGKGTVEDRGILFSQMASDGRYWSILKTTGGTSSSQTTGTVTMAGKEVFRHAAGKMAESVLSGLKALGMDISQIDLMVPHQANIRILNAMAEKIGFPSEKVVVTVDRHANTSAASIPLALAHAADTGQLSPGKIVALPALGAGLTWGVCLIRW